MISPEQCLAARAMLRLSRAEVTERAGIAAATLVEFEAGRRTPTPQTITLIKNALVSAGVEFTDENGPGVRLRQTPPPKEEPRKVPIGVDEERLFLIDIGERARNARLKAGLSQADVYARAKIPAGHVSQIELANVNITLLTLYRLAKAVGVHPKDLIR